MRQLGFGSHVDKFERGLCPLCGKEIYLNSFRDELSRREYKISGICQACQDKVLGKD